MHQVESPRLFLFVAKTPKPDQVCLTAINMIQPTRKRDSVAIRSMAWPLETLVGLYYRNKLLLMSAQLVSCIISFSARRLWEVSHKTLAGIYDRVIAVCIAQVILISSILGSMAIKKVKKCLQSVLKYEFLGVVLSFVGCAIIKKCCSLCTSSLKEEKMERVGGPVPYNCTYVVVEAWMWRRLRHSRATNSIKRRRGQGEIHVEKGKTQCSSSIFNQTHLFLESLLSLGGVEMCMDGWC
jgi:hypothetical protein